MNNKFKFKNDVSNTSIIIKKLYNKYLKLLSNQNRKVLCYRYKGKKIIKLKLNENLI